MDYQDFVLQLDRGAGERDLVARVLRSPAGEAEAPFVNPISTSELEGLWQAALAVRQAERGARDLAPAVSPRAAGALANELSLEDLGDRLFKALFQSAVRSCWVRSHAEATRGPKGGLRLQLQLDLGDPRLAPLAELPWEYLYSLEQCGFVGLQRKTPILRHMRLPLPVGRAPAVRPLRLLIVSSQPDSMSRLELADESERIAESLGSVRGVDAVPLRNPTVETLRETLLRHEFHILHFMGHGGFDPESAQGALYFAGSNGGLVAVSGALLASHLAGLDSLRLVFVNACETARSGARAPFAGVATALLRAGLPAVIAMQRPVRDSSALEFSRSVYRRLAVGDPIDAAVTEGRLAIARGHGALLEWGTPVLFLRADDGRLFDLGQPPAQHQAPALAEREHPPAPAANRSRRILYGGLLAGAVAVGVVIKQWPAGQAPAAEPGLTSEAILTSDSRLPETFFAMTTETRPEPPHPDPKQDKSQPFRQPHRGPERTERREAEKPTANGSYVLGQGSPVSIPDLGAQVGASFYERDGHAFARFWVAPSGQAMLQQPPVVGPGPIAFPTQDGTYHLDVQRLDLAAKQATVRLQFVPEATGVKASSAAGTPP
jgi:CHAT domain-containing protein